MPKQSPFHSADAVSQAPSKSLHRNFTSLIFAVVSLLAGCSTPVNQTVSFDEAAYKDYEASGTAIIQGHAFVRSDTGMQHAAAGIRISLVPLTAYTEERARIMESSNEPAPADPRLETYIKTVVGDWGGAFKFEGLPAGKYLIFCKIQWEPANPNGRRRDASGDFYALARVQISKGERENVVVTNLDQK